MMTETETGTVEEEAAWAEAVGGDGAEAANTYRSGIVIQNTRFYILILNEFICVVLRHVLTQYRVYISVKKVCFWK